MTTPHDAQAIRQEMDLTHLVIDQRKRLVDLSEDEIARLAELDRILSPHVGEIVDDLCQTLVTDGQGRAVNPDHEPQLLRDYFGGLTASKGVGEAFVNQRLDLVGELHDRVSADAGWFLAAHHFFLRAAAGMLRKEALDPADARSLHEVLRKVIFVDLGLAIDAYIFERDRTISVQRRELELLSTPVLQLRAELLLLPIIGALDTRRAQQLTDQLLHAISDNRARVVVLDVTGVGAVDSRVANHLIQTVAAVRLMGAEAIVTGLSPEVAQTLVSLGIDLGNVHTMADLQGGLEAAECLLAPGVGRQPATGAG